MNTKLSILSLCIKSHLITDQTKNYQAMSGQASDLLKSLYSIVPNKDCIVPNGDFVVPYGDREL